MEPGRHWEELPNDDHDDCHDCRYGGLLDEVTGSQVFIPAIKWEFRG